MTAKRRSEEELDLPTPSLSDMDTRPHWEAAEKPCASGTSPWWHHSLYGPISYISG